MKKTVESGKRNTMNRVLAAAREEFSAKGLAGARVEDIAKEVGVTKQLVYHYYGSKEGLFVAVLDETSQGIHAELARLEIDHLTPPEALRAVLNQFFDQYCNDPLLGKLAQEGIRYHGGHDTPRNRFLESTPLMIDKAGKILQRGAESGDFKPGIEPRLFLAAAALLTTGWFTNGYSTSALAGMDTTSAEGLATWRRYSADFILASISSPAA
ncbi:MULTISPECIES: TetR/AcrR family transcriptional regulator [unclassified Pseudomonas]|uniref:TetR/AcrR family transcriptional regulator n=1 Tax=unclassified Pseudomonas TaxID=196821 RepID=UPI0025E4D208|nr:MULTISPECIES: TetR/AcrR family transcriptional regulator [unclassified Pseudomonas]